jgi:hypothetical protein
MTERVNTRDGRWHAGEQATSAMVRKSVHAHSWNGSRDDYNYQYNQRGWRGIVFRLNADTGKFDREVCCDWRVHRKRTAAVACAAKVARYWNRNEGSYERFVAERDEYRKKYPRG